jgi:hypothetical protein
MHTTYLGRERRAGCILPILFNLALHRTTSDVITSLDLSIHGEIPLEITSFKYNDVIGILTSVRIMSLRNPSVGLFDEKNWGVAWLIQVP